MGEHAAGKRKLVTEVIEAIRHGSFPVFGKVISR